MPPLRIRLLLLAALVSGCGAGLVVPSVAQEAVVCREGEGVVELLCRDRPVLRYHTAVVEPPAGIAPVFRRSGFIHPVWTPQGRVVTADFPADHPHQHGLFCAWVKTTFEGREVDFWNQAGETGRVEHVRLVSLRNEPDFAEFTVELRHSDLTAPAGPRPVLRELWTIRGRDVPQGFLFDLESRQTCIAESPLIVQEYHYGGMGFRGAEAWFAPRGEARFQFLTSEGLGRLEGNHTRPHWVAAHGEIDGGECGIAIMGHPRNFRHPEPVRLHPTKPYFVFSPCVLGEFRLEPGIEHRARYRYYVYDGPLDRDAIERVWEAYRQEQLE